VDGPILGLLAQWGPGSALLVFFLAVGWSILRGHLISRRAHLDRVNDFKERIAEIAAERDAWHTAHDTSEGTRRIMAEQVQSLLAQGQLTNQLLESLKSRANGS